MADAQRTIDLVFNGVDKTGAAVQSALNNTEKFAGNVQTATQPIADFTASAVKLEAALLASGLAATAFAVKIAGDFDTAFREIATLIDEPIENLGEFRGAIQDYADSSTKPLEEITQSIYNAISAGVDYADSIEAVALAEQLSVAGKATLNDSLLVLVSSLNAYGVGMEHAERFSNALFTTVKQGQTTLPELSSSLASVTGLAATAGVDFEELLAAIATLTATGTPTSQAVTQIQGAISAILKPTSQATSLAAELGIQFDAQRLKAVGLTGILTDVANATDGNTTQMARLFGRVEALNGVLTLTGLGAEKFSDNLVAMRNSAGAVEEAFAVMSQAIDLQAQRVQNALTGIFIAVGDPLLDEFSGVTEAITAIFNALADSAASDNGVGEVVAYIEAQFAGLQDTLAEVARNLPEALELADFTGFTNGVDAVADAISSLFSDIDLSTAEGLAEAVTLVGTAFESLSEFTGGVIESFKPLFDQLRDVGAGVSELGPDFFKAAGEMAGFATQANILAGIVADMVPVISALTAVIGVNQAVGLAGSFTTAALALQGSSGLLALLGKTGLVGAAGGAGYAVGTLANNVSELTTGNSISTWALDGLAAIGLLDDGSQAIADALNEVTPAAESAGRAVADSTGDMAEAGKAMGDLASATEDSAVLLDIYTGEMATIGDTIPLFEAVNEEVSATTQGLGEAADATKEFSDAADKISLEEKLALIESQAQITIARIEASAEVVQAAFGSVDSAIAVTTESITDLFGLLGDDNISKFDKLDISKQIELQNERLTREFELQERLTKATIAEMQARTRRLNEGGALITVNGDGLQPHLEAIMYELLEAIQVRVNAQGHEMLLGV